MRREIKTDRHTGKKSLRRGRQVLVWNIYSQGTPRSAGKHQKIEETKKDPVPRAFRESVALLTAEFHTSRPRIVLCVLLQTTELVVICYGSLRGLTRGGKTRLFLIWVLSCVCFVFSGPADVQHWPFFWCMCVWNTQVDYSYPLLPSITKDLSATPLM